MIEPTSRYTDYPVSKGVILEETDTFAEELQSKWEKEGKLIFWKSDDSVVAKVADIFRSLVVFSDTKERCIAIIKRRPYSPYFLKPILLLEETCRLSAIILKISCTVGASDHWWRIPRSSTKTTAAIYGNTKKNLYIFLPKKSDLDIGAGLVKWGRKAVLLSKQDDHWQAKVIWNLKAKSEYRARISFMESREVEKKVIAKFPREEKVFPEMLWDFTIPLDTAVPRDISHVRSVFYEYWPMYMRYMCAKYIADKNPLTGKKDPVVSKILLNSAKVVRKLHEKKVAHGDIKLDNFLINHSLECRLCDPDSIVFTDDPMDKDSTTRKCSYTPDYLSFEVFKAKQQKIELKIDPLREDIYALGCMFYNLFMCSELPWERRTVEFCGMDYIAKLRGSLNRKTEEAKNKLTAGSKDITESLIYWMLHPKAEQRPTINDVIYWLEQDAAYDSMDSIEIAE